MPNHPKSLKIFFATEMWERYGFYVVQALLALYLAFHFRWPDKQIYALLGSFTALTYLSPLPGGWIADRFIGQKRAVLTGALILFISYCFLANSEHPLALTFALAGVAVGTGLLKPNISSLLGNEYPENSPRRDSGFIIFYLGITSGIILGTTLPSVLNKHFGWTASFSSAAISMILAGAIFGFGIRHYKIADYTPFVFQWKKIAAALGVIVFLWSLYFYMLNSAGLANLFFTVIALLAALYIVHSAMHEPNTQAHHTLVIGLLCLISVVFWAFYFQMFMSLTLFISRLVAPELFGITFHPPYYVTIESIGMLIIGYFLAKRHRNLSLLARGLNAGKQFASAMWCILFAYALIAGVCYYSENIELISPLLIIPAYLMISLAELLLSPVGLSTVSALAARKKVSTMVGIFFVSLGLGGYLSGKLASLSAIPDGKMDMDALKVIYTHAFGLQVIILFTASVLCLGIYWLITWLLRSVDE